MDRCQDCGCELNSLGCHIERHGATTVIWPLGLHSELACFKHQLAQKVVRVCNDCGALVAGSLEKRCDKCGSLEGELIEVAYPKLCTRIIDAEAKYSKLADSYKSLREAAGKAIKNLSGWLDGEHPDPDTAVSVSVKILRQAITDGAQGGTPHKGALKEGE